MVDPQWTAIHNTPNKSIRQNVARRGVVLHHAAMTSLDGLRYLTMGGKQVSATAIVKDGNRERMMTDEYRAWSLSSAYWDSACRSVETANESTNGWTISDASHWSLARLVAYWAERDGFWPHRDGNPKEWTVLGHREVYSIHGASYATACPGGMDLDLVTKRAQDILRGSDPAGGGGTPIEEDDMALFAATQNTSPRTIKAGNTQRFLNDKGQPISLTPHVGRVDVTLHVYGENLTEGKSLDLYVIRHNQATGKESPHYVETIHGTGDGTFKRSVSYKLDLSTGFVLVAEMRARGGDVKINVTGSEAYTFLIR